MESVIQWVRSIAILYVVGQVLVYLAQGKKYEKYIHFYVQLVLLLAITRPVFSLLGDEEEFRNRISFHEFSQEMQEQKAQLEQLQSGSNDLYIRECEQLVEEDVSEFLGEQSDNFGEVKVTLSEELEIEHIGVSVGNGTDARKLSDALCEHYQLSEEQVEVDAW
ncbi:MAG: stage III sporulation protein AF [Roseburia sp.]